MRKRNPSGMRKKSTWDALSRWEHFQQQWRPLSWWIGVENIGLLYSEHSVCYHVTQTHCVFVLKSSPNFVTAMVSPRFSYDTSLLSKLFSTSSTTSSSDSILFNERGIKISRVTCNSISGKMFEVSFSLLDDASAAAGSGLVSGRGEERVGTMISTEGLLGFAKCGFWIVDRGEG